MISSQFINLIEIPKNLFEALCLAYTDSGLGARILYWFVKRGINFTTCIETPTKALQSIKISTTILAQQIGSNQASVSKAIKKLMETQWLIKVNGKQGVIAEYTVNIKKVINAIVNYNQQFPNI